MLCVCGHKFEVFRQDAIWVSFAVKIVKQKSAFWRNCSEEDLHWIHCRTIKAYEVTVPCLFNLGTEWGLLVSFALQLFASKFYHWIGGALGPGARLGGLNRKISCVNKKCYRTLRTERRGNCLFEMRKYLNSMRSIQQCNECFGQSSSAWWMIQCDLQVMSRLIFCALLLFLSQMNVALHKSV